MQFVNLIVDTFRAVTSATVGALTATTATVATASLGDVTLTGATASGVTVLLKDAAGKALLATGTSVPSNATDGYAKGCLFIDTDVATGTTGLYCNKGTSSSCVFTAVTQA
mgnify:CR=1 FL=1